MSWMETMSVVPSPSIRISGPWNRDRVQEYLAETRIPMRLAANTDTGFPIVLSLWFLAEADELLAVVHRDARIAKRLKETPCAGHSASCQDDLGESIEASDEKALRRAVVGRLAPDQLQVCAY